MEHKAHRPGDGGMGHYRMFALNMLLSLVRK